MPPHEEEIRHYHNESQQFFYVLSGIAQVEISGAVFEVSAGSGIHVSAKEPHQVMNKGKLNVRFLVVSQPESHGDRVNA